MQGTKTAAAPGSKAANQPRNAAPNAANNTSKKANKKKQGDKPKSNGKEESDVKSASAPPPGFAPAPVSTPTTGFSEHQQRLLRHRALFAFRFLVGKAVEVQLVDSSRYIGILDCIDPDDFSVVLKNTQRKSESSEPFDSGSTVIFKRRQLAHMSADGVVNYTEGAVGATATATAGFRTDTEISGRSHEHLYGRDLEMASSWLDPQLDTGELEDTRRRSSAKNAWNQFEANEKLFGVVSTFDENLYTTKLDKTKISNEQSRQAELLAREIERETTGNFHLQEERGQKVQREDLDEEALYSSVDRKQKTPSPTAVSRGPNAYVPPALRNAQQKQIAAGPAQTKPASPSAKTPATPAAAPPAGAASRKPLSFSEAVTGRTASAPAKEEPKPVSPKKAAPPAKNGQAKASSPAPKENKSSSKAPASQNDKKASKPAAGEKPAKTEGSSTAVAAAKPLTAPAKKGLNPNAKEFKLSASAAEFTPKFMAPAATATSSPYRHGAQYPPHMHPAPHPGMGYAPAPEEWVYDPNFMLDDSEYAAAAYMGYGMPMVPNPAMMQQPVYPPMMHQQPVMRGQRGHGDYGGYAQQGMYNPRGYYGQGAPGYPAGAAGAPQPPLPREPTPTDGTASPEDASAENAGATPPASKSDAKPKQ